MRISDWSSDVCSSDLLPGRRFWQAGAAGFHCRSGGGRQGGECAGENPLEPRGRHAGWLLPFGLRTTPASCLGGGRATASLVANNGGRSEEHTSALQALMRISYAGFCLKKKNNNTSQSHI